MAVLGNTNLTGCNSIPDFIPTGTRILFYQAAAPTGWTKITDHNNKALRVVSGNGGGSGGSTAFTSVFASRTTAGSVSAHTLTLSQIPFHGHSFSDPGHTHNVFLARGPLVQSGGADGFRDGGNTSGALSSNTTGITFSSQGSSQSHSHGFVGGAMDFAVQYIDVIICSKN